MPKQDETITLTDPDTGDTMYIRAKEEIELKTVVGEMPTGTALKFDDGKLPLHLLSTEAMNQTAAVLQFGADKYAALAAANAAYAQANTANTSAASASGGFAKSF